MVVKDDIIKDTQNYYEKTQIDYNLFWMNKKNLAMHYGLWEKGMKKLHDALVNENKVFAEELEMKKEDVVLDAGCGVGGSSIYMAENYGSRVTGITVVGKQIEQANNNAKKRKVDNLVSFKRMDYCETDFPDESFDKIYAMESMCYAPDKQLFLKEMYRLLKPNGILLIADVFLDGSSLGKRENTQLNDWREGWAVPNTPILDDFCGSIDKIGFRDAAYMNMKNKIMPSAKRIYKIGRIFYPFDRVCNKLGIVSDTTFKSTVAMLAQYHLFKEDTMRYFLIKVEKV